VAERYLTNRGYRVLDRRWRPSGWKRGEIDLIVRKGEEVVFVEVKARLNRRYGRPEEAVHWRKRQQLRALAAAWLTERQAWRRPYRIDVVAVQRQGSHWLVRHLQNAVGADG
jgi:putative endonuclease